MKRFLGWILAFLIYFIPQAEASYGQGLWFFGGLGAGYVSVTSKEVNPNVNQVNPGQSEQDKMGYALHIKGGASWYFSKLFVGDAMLGWEYSDITGKPSSSMASKVNIHHQVGFLNLSPRFRFGNEGVWQLGPMYKIKFGTDTSYTEREGQNLNEEPLTHYVGLHLNYDLPSFSEKTVYRFGIEPLIDLSNPRTILTVNLLFELGFKLFSDSNESYNEVAKEEPEKIEEDLEQDLPEEPLETVPEEIAEAEVAPVEVDPNAVTAKSFGNAVLVKIPGDKFLFATGMSHIGSAIAKSYLRDLGQFLAANQGSWQKATVVGHTDRRGPKGRAREVNMELSAARAATVRNTLIAAGVDASKLESFGKAFDEPIPGAPDNAKGWRLNRRVELTFQGVKAPEKLLSQIKELNRKYN